ncbi:MAG TPA: MarR family transcriptional regulator [Candidatus Limnocylindria bacterium]
MEAFERFHERLFALNTPDVLDVNLTLAQLKAIYVVAFAGPLTMGALSERLRTGLSTTSETVDRLVRRGFLDRRDDPTDRRQVLVEATTAAREQIERMSELNLTRHRQMLERLDPADIKTVDRAIRVMTDAMADMNEEIR